jgi:NADPH-dependent 2,4-dienoyl-CoA reductase/sulfur reductase-like enzyme/rhodanese-related sulfurtransferase
MDKSDVVIIGGVACGPKTAAVLARRMPEAKVTLFQKEKHLSYASCGLPWLASGDLHDHQPLLSTAYGAVRDAAFFKDVKGIEAIVDAEVTAINRTEKYVDVRHGDGQTSRHGYEKLVLATGSRAMPCPVAAPDSPRIRPFHSLADALHFRSLAEQGKVGRAAIIGGGLIGLEVTVAIGDLWGIEQIVIEKESHVLPWVLDPEMAELVHSELRAHGVDLRTGAALSSITLNESGQPVVACDGYEPAAVDYVFVCCGVNPNTDLAVQCGLGIGATGGIVVNDQLQTSDPDIYAGGDCIESKNRITGQPLYIPMGSLANRHGRVIAEHIAGRATTFPGAVGSFVTKVFDLNVGAVGLSQHAAQKTELSNSAVWGSYLDRPDYMPENAEITAKLVYEPDSGRVLGYQCAGTSDISKKVDVVSSCLQFNAGLEDLTDLEHGYAPPFSQAMDSLNHLAAFALAQQGGLVCLPPHRPNGAAGAEQWVDVREPEEFEDGSCGDGVINMPIGDLRNRVSELDRSRPLRVLCARGPRAYQAALILKAAGFEDVAVIGGGLHALPK